MPVMPSSALILLPCALDDQSDPEQAVPLPVLQTLRGLSHFVVEDAKTARAWLKRCAWPRPLTEASMIVWDEHTASAVSQRRACIEQVLSWLKTGNSVGLLSEAGLPAVADPGQALIEAVHQAGFSVRPHVGPSSIMLALMASGLNGQHFEFLGYLPATGLEREAKLRMMESQSRQDGRSLLWIETPYRNEAMMESILKCLHEDTSLCVASALGTEKETIYSASVRRWRQHTWRPGREPSVFILACEPSSAKTIRVRQDLKSRLRKHP